MMALDPLSVQNKNPILCGQAVFVVKEQKTYDVLKKKKTLLTEEGSSARFSFFSMANKLQSHYFAIDKSV